MRVGAPAGLGQWTTEPAPAATGSKLGHVPGSRDAPASQLRRASGRPATFPGAAPTTAPRRRLDSRRHGNGFLPQNATVSCFDATGSGLRKPSDRGGVHFIHGYGNDKHRPATASERVLQQPKHGLLRLFQFRYFPASARTNSMFRLTSQHSMACIRTSWPRHAAASLSFVMAARCSATATSQLRPTGKRQAVPTFATQGNGNSPHADRCRIKRYAVAIEVMLRNAVNNPKLSWCRLQPQLSLVFYTGSGASLVRASRPRTRRSSQLQFSARSWASSDVTRP